VPVAFGGDGTLHEVLIGCVRRGLPLGLLPGGSGNDFAFALGLARDDLDGAIAALIAGTTRTVDVGWVGDEPFVNSFGTGFDADAARRAHEAPTFYRGLGKYLYAIATAMRDFRVLDAAVHVDGELVFSGPSLLVTVQNGPRTGASFLFSPEAKVDDGLFDVVIAGRFGRLGTLGILPRVIKGTHLEHERVHLFRGRDIHIEWSESVATHAEGEIRPFGREFTVRLAPRSLTVIAPPVAEVVEPPGAVGSVEKALTPSR
jgi:diacylglycerol kinase (ATP)